MIRDGQDKVRFGPWLYQEVFGNYMNFLYLKHVREGGGIIICILLREDFYV